MEKLLTQFNLQHLLPLFEKNGITIELLKNTGAKALHKLIGDLDILEDEYTIIVNEVIPEAKKPSYNMQLTLENLFAQFELQHLLPLFEQNGVTLEMLVQTSTRALTQMLDKLDLTDNDYATFVLKVIPEAKGKPIVTPPLPPIVSPPTIPGVPIAEYFGTNIFLIHSCFSSTCG